MRFYRSGIWLAVVGIGVSHINSQDFKDPVRLKADGKYIDTEVGHSAPFVGDFDGDGKNELLVGQFGGGKLWIYNKADTASLPQLSDGRLFKNGDKGGTVPTG